MLEIMNKNDGLIEETTGDRIWGSKPGVEGLVK